MNELHGPGENPIILDFNSLGNRDKSLLVGALFRQSLIQTGKSPDYHLDKLEDDFLAHAGGAAGSFLRKVKEFSLRLDPLEGEIFVNECLEHGRHYKFWYLSYYDTPDFQLDLHSIYDRVAAEF